MGTLNKSYSDTLNKVKSFIVVLNFVGRALPDRCTVKPDNTHPTKLLQSFFDYRSGIRMTADIRRYLYNLHVLSINKYPALPAPG